jgi:hypothetical protein
MDNTDGIFRANWKNLCESLTEISSKLHMPKDDYMPISKLSAARVQANSLLERIVQQSIYRIGNINMKREITAVINRIDGIRNGLKEGELNTITIQPILSDTRAKIQGIYTEVASKVDRQLLNAHLSNYKKQQQNRENVEDIEASEKFNNFSDAMQQALEYMQKQGSGVVDIDKNQSRDIFHMTSIIEKNKKDLDEMKLKLKKAKLGEDKETFTALRGPVITSSNLSVHKLQSTDIDYDVVYFPGINFGFKRKENVPRMYILRNQLLIAVMLNKKKKKGFTIKLDNVPLEKTEKKKDKRFSELREDIIKILQNRLNYDFVDVMSERGLSNDFLANHEFPKIRFIWIMKKSTYNHVGPFTTDEKSTLGLPF